MPEKMRQKTIVRATTHPGDTRTNIPTAELESFARAEGEATLLDQGSTQSDLWGINLYPADSGALGWIEFDSMIKVRTRLGNRSRLIEDDRLRQRIIELVDGMVRP